MEPGEARMCSSHIGHHQGPPACNDACNSLWCPDKEEQRYCWGCHKWYNLKCLGQPVGTQSEYLNKQMENHSTVPTTIMKVAFQPTARGGKTHFVTSNIRLVSAARDLLNAQVREEISANGWMIASQMDHDEGDAEYDEWQAWLEYKYNLDGEQRGNIQEEQMLIEGQQMYTCSQCQSTSQM